MTGDATPVLAAGAVVWRDGPAGVEVCLVHRPRHDDWSLPKGKLDRGEHLLACAAREVAEETGIQVALGRPLPSRRYQAEGRPKEVRYWLAEAGSAAPRAPDDEVDDVRFVPVADAVAQLTYARDAELVTEAIREPLRTTPLVLLRHAEAVEREAWTDPDVERPLAPAGLATLPRLTAALAALGPRRVISSPARRCVDSMKPLAELLRLPVEEEPLLWEEGLPRSPRWETAEGFVSALLDGDGAVVCSHRPVLPLLFAAVGMPDPALPPGGFVVLHHRDGAVVATERH